MAQVLMNNVKFGVVEVVDGDVSAIQYFPSRSEAESLFNTKNSGILVCGYGSEAGEYIGVDFKLDNNVLINSDYIKEWLDPHGDMPYTLTVMNSDGGIEFEKHFSSYSLADDHAETAVQALTAFNADCRAVITNSVWGFEV